MDDAIMHITHSFTGLLTALHNIFVSDTAGDAYWQTYCDRVDGDRLALDWDWAALLHPSERATTIDALAAALATRAPYDCEFRLLHADGNYRRFVARAKVQADGGVCRWLGYCSDITGRTEAESALLASMTRATAILNTAIDSIITLDSTGHITSLNPAAEQMFGYTTAACIGQSMPALLFAPLTSETHQTALLHFLCPATEIAPPRRLEMIGKHADGLLFPVDIAITSTELYGQIWHTAYIKDISEVKNGELALIESERRSRLIFEYAAVGIVQTDLLGTYQRVNRAFCNMLGFRDDELIGRTFHDVTLRDDWNTGTDGILAMMRGEQQTCVSEKRYLHKSGAIVWTRLTMSMVYDAAGQPVYCLAVVEDITQQKLLEAEHAQLRERDQQAQEQANIMAARFSALHAIADTALAHLALKELLPELLDRIRTILTVDNIAILLLTEDKQFLTIYATRGFEESVADTLRIPVGMGMAGQIVVSREPVVIDDLSLVNVVNSLLHEKLKSLVGVPLLVGGRVIGVIHISTAYRRHFTEEEVRLLQLVADRIALAIDHEQMYGAEQSAHAEAVAHAGEFEAIFETIADGVSVYDADGNARRMNKAALRLLGIHSLAEIHHGSAGERSLQYQLSTGGGQPLTQAEWPLSRILQGESTDLTAADISLLNHMGERVNLAISGAPMHDDAGRVTGAVLIWRDITAQRLLAQRTQTSLDALLQMASLLVGDEAITLNGAAQAMSPLLVKQLALLARSILGCELLALVALAPDGTILAPMTTAGLSPMEEEQWQMASQGQSIQSFLATDVVAQLAAGEHAIVRLTSDDVNIQRWRLTTTLLVPLYIDDRCIGILLVDFQQDEHPYSDQEIALANTIARLLALATEHERLLREREHVLTTLQQLNEELALQNEQLQEVSKLKSEFLANMSHELRTPLNGIIGFTQMLQAEFIGAVTAEQKDVLHDILASAKHLLYLINAILDLAKVESGKMEFDVVAVNLPAIIREVTDTLQPLFLQKQLHFTVTIDAAITDLTLDPAKLKQVLYNYLSNAIKFTPEAGHITLTIAPRDDGRFRVAVADTGIGIKAEDISSLFVEFQQLDSGHAKKYPGTGLGLALTKRIIQAQGGEVGVHSNIGAGSCFWFDLPCHAAA